MSEEDKTAAWKPPRPPEIAPRGQSVAGSGQSRSALYTRRDKNKEVDRLNDSDESHNDTDKDLEDGYETDTDSTYKSAEDLLEAERDGLYESDEDGYESDTDSMYKSAEDLLEAEGERVDESDEDGYETEPDSADNSAKDLPKLHVNNVHDKKQYQYDTDTDSLSESSDSYDPRSLVSNNHLDINFSILGNLGSGSFGDVLKVRSKLDKVKYALKKIVLDQDRPRDHAAEIAEAQYLAKLQHNNIVRYYASWIEDEAIGENEDSNEEEEDEQQVEADGESVSESSEESEEEASSDSVVIFEPPSGADGRGGENNSRCRLQPVSRICLYILMEYCEKGTLRTALPRLHLDQQRLYRLFREIVEGLSHVHSHRLIHRDLKPENIFLDRNDHIKIADFGLATSKVVRSQPDGTSCPPYTVSSENGITCPTCPVGTPLYCAPELEPVSCETNRRHVYNEKVDIYSLGIIWFEMCCGKFNTNSERIHRLLQLREPGMWVDEDMSQRLTDLQLQLLRWMLEHDPKKRSSCEELLRSELVPSPPLE